MVHNTEAVDSRYECEGNEFSASKVFSRLTALHGDGGGLHALRGKLRKLRSWQTSFGIPVSSGTYHEASTYLCGSRSLPPLRVGARLRRGCQPERRMDLPSLPLESSMRRPPNETSTTTVSWMKRMRTSTFMSRNFLESSGHDVRLGSIMVTSVTEEKQV